ncbi:unnamed protein product [Mytilus coruscus]|uniref:Reverse transcriptase domain-containing protein n=1 Tax=Mytilus coruscus TaxID=42192 RepID=A0A6J8EBG6_MYTCO|nr:unnamed protein product [Mytilus coruscus]
MCEIPVIIPKHYLNKPIILEPHDYLEKYQLMGACCSVQATWSKNARVRMQIINPNNYIITLHVNTVVAMVSHVDVSTLQTLSDSENQTIDENHMFNVEEKSNLKKKKKLSEIGQTNIYQHEIKTTHEMPMRTPPYRASPIINEEIQRQVDLLLENDIIRPSTSPYNSAVVLVKNKDNSFRMTIDYRKINAVLEATFYPLPNLNDVFDADGTVKPKFGVLRLCQWVLANWITPKIKT